MFVSLLFIYLPSFSLLAHPEHCKQNQSNQVNWKLYINKEDGETYTQDDDVDEFDHVDDEEDGEARMMMVAVLKTKEHEEWTTKWSEGVSDENFKEQGKKIYINTLWMF